MEELIDKIRAAMAADATAEARTAGAAACRCVLALIEPTPTPAIPPDVVPKMVAMVRGMDLDQLLGVAVERLRAVTTARGETVPTEPPRSINIPMVPIPRGLNGGA